MKKILFTYISIILSCIAIKGQNIDSLEMQLAIGALKPDKQIHLLSKIYYSIHVSDSIALTLAIQRMMDVAPHLYDSISKAVFYSCLGHYYKQQDKIDLAINQYDKIVTALERNRSNQAKIETAKAIMEKGIIFQQYDDYETAYHLYLKAEMLFMEGDEYNKLIDLYSRMGNIFIRNDNFERNSQILQKAEAIIDKITDLDALSGYYISRGVVASNSGDMDKAISFAQQALEILGEIDAPKRRGTIYYNQGYNYYIKKEYAISEEYYRKSLKEFEKIGDKFDICDGILAIGRILYFQERYNDSEPYLLKALEMAQEIRSKLLIRNAYTYLSYMEYGRGDYKKAYEYQDKCLDYEVELLSESGQKQLIFLEAKYDSDKKEAIIASLEERQQFIVWLAVTIGTIILLGFGLLLFRHRLSLQKRRLAEQKWLQAEQEKQLIATQSVLEGETSERTRLARDLHDGLGGMLSVVKLNLKDVKGYAVMDEHDVDRFQKAISTLEMSIRELRRVAHHMMPESLFRNGLKYSLADFCREIPSIHFTYIGEDRRVDSQVEVMLYRCALELINNAIKHANAQNIYVQLLIDSALVALTVRDDGIGFLPHEVTQGAGLKNINARISAFHGNLNIHSEPMKGSEISIEIELT